MKVNGSDIYVFFQMGGRWKTLAFGTTCEIDIQAETKAVSSPDTGLWEKLKKGRFTWSGSSGHLLAEGRQETEVIEIIKSAEALKVAFSTVAPSDLPRDFRNVLPDGRFGLSGMANITRLTVTAKVGDNTAFSLSFNGTGKLEKL